MKNSVQNVTLDMLNVCSQHNVSPVLPADDQLIVVSEGVLNGKSVEGVRYSSPDHMTGWWITTAEYNGDTDTLRTEHFKHLLEKRPDLSKFMALPHGFRFFEQGYKGNKENIWFDSEIAEKHY